MKELEKATNIIKGQILEVVAEALCRTLMCAEYEYSASRHAESAANRIIEILDIEVRDENDS